MFSIDTKGGNRPIRLVLRSDNVSQASFGNNFLLAYAFGDKIVIQDNWQVDKQNEHREQSYALEESLHGREILAVQSILLKSGKHLVITGSEDTYLKVCELNERSLKLV